jgi:hypothetical protein
MQRICVEFLSCVGVVIVPKALSDELCNPWSTFKRDARRLCESRLSHKYHWPSLSFNIVRFALPQNIQSHTHDLREIQLAAQRIAPMSGTEAIAAIQLIDACIGIARAIFDVSEAVTDAQGLPRKLRNLCEKLPAIEQLLKSARDSCKEGRISEDASKSAQPILRQCEQTLAELQDIFQKACPQTTDNCGKRIWKGGRAVFFGRDSQVQKLLVSVQDNLKLLEQREIFSIGDGLDELQRITEELAHDEASKYTHIGGGHIVANEGGSPANFIMSGSGRQINNPGVYNEGPSST